ncbi:MAG: hypothetical protein IPJ66_17425 [Bacteroidetes bacterium]|nr:hypothetical protein [Bacteroidota bacterium]
MFFYYKRERANFYYGLFAFGFASIFFINYIEGSGTNIRMTNILEAVSTGIIIPFCSLTMIRLSLRFSIKNPPSHFTASLFLRCYTTR